MDGKSVKMSMTGCEERKNEHDWVRRSNDEGVLRKYPTIVAFACYGMSANSKNEDTIFITVRIANGLYTWCTSGKATHLLFLQKIRSLNRSIPRKSQCLSKFANYRLAQTLEINQKVFLVYSC